MNKVILKGRIARDPETRSTTTGRAVTTFNLAVDRPYSKNKEKQEADFIPVVAWDKLAEIIQNYCFKGKELLVEGRMQIRSYETQDGSKRYVTEVIASEIEFCGSKNDSSRPAGDISGREVEAEDIPF